MDVGSELRQARQRRGLSLREMADRTKISAAALHAIETNTIERLPERIYTRGFLKAYAREVGLAPTDIADRFAAQFDVSPEPEDSGAARVVTDSGDSSVAQPTLTAAPRPERSPAVAVIITMAMIAACAVAFNRWYGARSSDQGGNVRLSEVALGRDEAPPVAAGPAGPGTATGTSGVSDTAASAGTSPGVVRLMRPGEQQTIEARHDVVLRVGDPASLAFSIDGRAGRPLGRPTAPVTITVTPNNYAEFLR
jgi:transcriptional regulator with XRE-family HTH domain